MIFIGLGSSIGNAEEIFASVEKLLIEQGIQVVKKSSILKNPPIGGVAKNEFSNAVWQVEPVEARLIAPLQLLKILQKIETDHGRTREKKWDDRTLDLDILIFHDEIINIPELQIPHPEISNRIFVLKPLSELVDETLEIPTLGALGSLIRKLTS
ncbi:2-amino-4-hydroxy-6-hydroxymethyldihydropteridine diphosphokinase [Candidatus Gracilibacteria bacterium]|nr:2-amino-4-hydroxy-6-hydroxymethyldihydropteridine diphosphokinase [Candidatus Gracilibacteria bacterium]